MDLCITLQARWEAPSLPKKQSDQMILNQFERSRQKRLTEIEPDTLVFHCENPDEEMHSTIRLHNTGNSPQIFKVPVQP